MTNIYELKNRQLVPNWRDFKRTIKIGELGLKNKSKQLIVDNSDIKLDWANNKTIGVAADLINNSFVSSELYSSELEEAIKFVETNSIDASNSLLTLIQQIKNELNPKNEDSTKVLERNIQSMEEFNSLFDDKIVNRIISKTKNLTRNYHDNAIYWIELARLYTIKGQLKQAEKCVTIALNLAPDNRFVLRSAVRFFIHIEEEERAIFYLRKSKLINSDPWLISAHIASSRLLNRYSPFIKKGLALVASKNYSDFDLTELASSLGTIELASGSFKKSKSLIELSISNPNDNSLAQFEWLSKKEQRLIFKPEQFINVKNPFEAFTYENFKKGNFKESFYNCIDWFLDMPFSKRPLAFGSYIATVLQEYDFAILLCLIGLKYDNNDVEFVNNLVYNYCLKNEIGKAEKYLNQYFGKTNVEINHNEVKITLQATVGLFYLRSNNTEEGKKFYEMAIENSLILKNNYYYNLAIINLTRELYYLNDDEFKDYFEKFKEIKTVDSDIIYQKEQVEKIINSTN
jgi:tetratricopeptide (TPR) repeat protein